MRGREQKRRVAITLFITIIAFCAQLITSIFAGAILYLLVQTDMISINKDVRPNIGAMLLLMFVVSMLVGTFIAYVFGRISTNPLHRLIHQIDRLASGDFKARLNFGPSLSRHPMFAELADSFNKMAEELENTEVLRGDFVNNFSHEFKTPIVSISGFAKLLRRGSLTEEQKQEYLSIIEEESLRLTAMATNILNLTRVENQTILTDISVYNLSEQLRSCILLLEDKWDKKQLDFNVDFREHFIFANEELLKQVWINLIDNAIKFSPEGGSIEIGIKKEHDAITVYVINSSEEIPIESQARIFNKFYQADSSHSTEGNGIGLAVVKKVVELHGGTVSVQSENNLTMFLVTIPQNQ